jgi:outer membrane biosynthesis protein TonB
MKSNNSQTDQKPEPSNSPLAHFFIYENLNYVADSKISKEQISIGRSHNADLVLNHSAVADIHAFIHFEGRQAFLTNRFPHDGLHLNGRSVHLAKLQHEDVIDIGPFALKIKMENDRGNDCVDHGTGRRTYSVALVNRYQADDEMQVAVGKLAQQFKADPVKMALIIAKPEYVIKKDLSKTEAERWQIALQKSGIFCEIRVMKPKKPRAVREVYQSHPAVQSKPADPPKPSPYEKIFTAETNDKPQKRVVKASTDYTTSTGMAAVAPAPDFFGTDPAVWLDDDDDDEENLWQAPFSLKEKLAGKQPSPPSAMQSPLNLQVVKTIGDRVVDVRYLGEGKKYTVSTEAGKLSLASNKSKKSSFVCIAHNFSGYIKDAKGETTADLNSYKRSDYLLKKRQRFYRIPVPKSGEIVIQDGQSQYRVFNSRPAQSPAVHVAEKPLEFTWKHWAVSAGTHLVLVLCLSIYWYFQAIAPKPSMPHFVKIDPTILQQLQPKPKKPPEPPKVEPPPKPEPQRVAEKVEPPKKTPKKQPPKPIAKRTKSKRKIKKVAKARRPSRHPKAGGGFGKGNIKNRNIKQTGLLSVLEKTPLAGPSTAIASVTNLDAVPVPDAGDKNFSVGGVKGSLGNGKISVATGEMLQTKGSDQVFRSAGAKGPGTVAALQRGSTGKKQVQGMVKAKMSRSVKIQGGMSREMVKRVIDQHLEEITYCYETALMSNPSIMGRIVFEWKIRMDGSVGQVHIVASSINSHDVHNCIKAAIKSWQFPKPMGTEVVVSYPFVFDLVAF